ncbi:MAG TPA: hypothetical protein VGO56_12365 [Pyrinomonadaceae bacterium]|nr:hypothetical protein [Pyrinomonadaceae bacterium]
MFDRDVERMRAFEDWKDEELRSIAAPALVVIGDRDLPTPEHAVEMYRLMARARLAILPGTHGSYMGEAMSAQVDTKVMELFVAMVEEFLADEAENSKQ